MLIVLIVWTGAASCTAQAPTQTAEVDTSAVSPAVAMATPPCDAPERYDRFDVLADIEAWEVYDDPSIGFRIRYPPGWVVDDEGFDVAAAAGDGIESIVFASPDVPGDFIWRINVRPKAYDWSLADEFPSFGGDRYTWSEPVAVDGADGVHYVSFTCQRDPLRSDTVIVEHEGTTFEIMGGAESSFVPFYESLEFTP